MKEPETPRQKRDALWRGAKEIQSRQIEVTTLQDQLHLAVERLGNAIQDYGRIVQTALPDQTIEEDK